MKHDELTARAWRENRLFSVLLELTYRCNLDCFFCYNDLSLQGDPMRLADYVALLDDLAAMGVMNLTLTGGEPLAHPDFFAIGRHARERGFVVRIKSNGHALGDAAAKKIREEIDPFLVEVSLHGATAATHDRQTRVAGSFDRLMTNIPAMLAQGLRVKINSTLTRWNESEAEGMYAIADGLGVPLRFDLQVSPRDDGDREPMTIAPTADGIRSLLELEDRRYSTSDASSDEQDTATAAPLDVAGKHCGAGSAGIAVDPYGNVYPCVQWRRAVGNLRQRSIAEIWTGEPLGRVRGETMAAGAVVRAHSLGKLLNFCPGLAESLTGSATSVPAELEERAALIHDATR